jgi:hypothetical protein
MTDFAKEDPTNIDDVQDPSARLERERIARLAPLQSQLSECLQRESVRELEITALHRELELQAAYIFTLEGPLQRHIDWLHSLIDHETHVFAAAQQRMTGELAAQELRIAELSRSLMAVQHELAAERQRLSYVLVQRLAERARGHATLLDWASRNLRPPLKAAE